MSISLLESLASNALSVINTLPVSHCFILALMFCKTVVFIHIRSQLV